MESSCVVVALIENNSTSKPLKVSPEKSQILSCDTFVANERYEYKLWPECRIFSVKHGDTESNQWALKE